MRVCDVEGCARRQVARGFCDLHYRRWKKHGNTQTTLPPGSPSGPTNPGWLSEGVGYSLVHHRLRIHRGRASEYTCLCGAPAKEWAYDFSDPDEKITTHERFNYVFSVDLSRYIPMCVSCHRNFDLAERVERLVAERLAELGFGPNTRISHTEHAFD